MEEHVAVSLGQLEELIPRLRYTDFHADVFGTGHELVLIQASITVRIDGPKDNGW